jgi:N6-L-threonylcarbamoyladenine synthase
MVVFGKYDTLVRMTILGIETSCDETAASVVRDGTELLSNVIVSQIDIHREFGGVVPEVAARSHIEVILPVVQKALDDAQLSWDDIDAIGVTKGPGLIGSLLIGVLTARTLALIKGKPLFGVHHVLGHMYANFITKDCTNPKSESLNPKQIQNLKSETRSQLRSTNYDLPQSTPKFPILALIVSGGHSQLVLFDDHFKYQLLGQTRDDAVGEAFDKVAKILGLPYPGGPSIGRAALEGNPNAYPLPDARLDSPYDFSFSGLKTAVLRRAQAEIGEDYNFPSGQIAERLSEAQVKDFAASFQYAAISTLVKKTCRAYDEHRPASVVIAGGVAASPYLREKLREALPIDIEYAPGVLCTDNAAMIASLTYFESLRREPDDPRTLGVFPSLSI